MLHISEALMEQAKYFKSIQNDLNQSISLVDAAVSTVPISLMSMEMPPNLPPISSARGFHSSAGTDVLKTNLSGDETEIKNVCSNESSAIGIDASTKRSTLETLLLNQKYEERQIETKILSNSINNNPNNNNNNNELCETQYEILAPIISESITDTITNTMQTDSIETGASNRSIKSTTICTNTDLIGKPEHVGSNIQHTYDLNENNSITDTSSDKNDGVSLSANQCLNNKSSCIELDERVDCDDNKIDVTNDLVKQVQIEFSNKQINEVEVGIGITENEQNEVFENAVEAMDDNVISIVADIRECVDNSTFVVQQIMSATAGCSVSPINDIKPFVQSPASATDTPPLSTVDNSMVTSNESIVYTNPIANTTCVNSSSTVPIEMDLTMAAVRPEIDDSYSAPPNVEVSLTSENLKNLDNHTKGDNTQLSKSLENANSNDLNNHNLRMHQHNNQFTNLASNPERSFSLESLNSEASVDSNDSKSSLKLAEIKFSKNGTLERQLAGSNTPAILPQNQPTGLQVLVLWNNKLTRESAQAVSDLVGSTTTLEMLNIGRNLLSNDFLGNVKQSLKTNTSLVSLGLQGVHLTCTGIKTLAEALEFGGNSTLQRIDVRDNHLQVPGLTALNDVLKSNKSVIRIDLDDVPRRLHVRFFFFNSINF